MNVIKPFRYYHKEEIENIATNLLQQVQEKRSRPLKTSIVAETVADFLDIGIVWDRIPRDSEGQIAAMILPTHKEIVINENIPELQGGFGQSTIAHEIGHWLLHINHQAVGSFTEYVEQGIEVPVQPFLCRSTKSLHGIEWQAQFFASCLLMPVDKLIDLKCGRDITNWRHLYAMADELGVTISNLTHRLRHLEWINLSKTSKQIYLGQFAPK